MDEKQKTFILKLKRLTEIGKLNWEVLEDDNVIRLFTTGSIISIEWSPRMYTISITDTESQDSSNVASFNVAFPTISGSRDAESYELVQDFYNSVVNSYRKERIDNAIDKALSSILK
jgi:hypothetical protein